MSKVQFEDELLYKNTISSRKTKRQTYLVGLLKKTGMSQQMAEYTLYGTFVICVSLTYIIVTNILFPSMFSEKQDANDLPIEVRMEREKFNYGKNQ